MSDRAASSDQSAADAADDGKLAFVIKLLRCGGPYYRAAVSCLATRKAYENDRVLRKLVAHFLYMRAKIHANTYDLVWIGYTRCEAHIFNGVFHTADIVAKFSKGRCGNYGA